MNILIINHYAGAPSLGMEFRHYYLAREWQKRDHNVLIICASYTHLRSTQFTLKKNIERHTVGGVNYLVLKSIPYSENDYKRFFNILFFIWRLIKYSKIIAKEFEPDIIISSSTYLFEIFAARKISKISKSKLIFEVKDLWPLALLEYGGYNDWHPFILLMQKAEEYAYKHSDRVVSLLPKALEYMAGHGLDSERFIYIPNGIMVEDWDIAGEIPIEINELINKVKSEGKRIICYAGNLGIANALYSLVDAMKILEKENVVLLFIGNGQEKDRLIKHTQKLKLKNIYFVPAISKVHIQLLLKEMDILYIGLKKQSVFRFGVSPNKLFDYMMAGKPIIQAINAGNDIVSEARCGITIQPENPRAIADAVRNLIGQSDSELKAIGERGRKYCTSQHDYKILSEKFLQVFDEIKSKV